MWQCRKCGYPMKEMPEACPNCSSATRRAHKTAWMETMPQDKVMIDFGHGILSRRSVLMQHFPATHMSEEQAEARKRRGGDRRSKKYHKHKK